MAPIESSSKFHLVSRLNLLLRDFEEMRAMMERDGAIDSGGDGVWGGTAMRIPWLVWNGARIHGVLVRMVAKRGREIELGGPHGRGKRR
jgi:hypothetical protein